MQLFGDFREDGWNTYYDGRHTPAFFDVKMAVLVFSATVAMTVLVIVVIGARTKRRSITFLRHFMNLQPGIAILVCLTGKNWIDSHIHTYCEFSTTASPIVEADVAIMVGLKSINITMSGFMNMTAGEVKQIAYNEQFIFGKVSSLGDSLQNSLGVGRPSAILYVLDYLRQDGGELRWAREMRMAGHFVYIMLWSSLASWLVAQLVLAFVVVRGALFLALTGVLMAGSCGLYCGLHPGTKLTIPFEDSYMSFHYGWCFWLCGVAGFITLLWSLIILIGHFLHPDKMTNTFHVDAYRIDSYSPSTIARRSPLVLPTPNQERRNIPSTAIFYENKAFTFEEHNINKRLLRNDRQGDQFPDGVNFNEMASNQADQDQGPYIDDSISDHLRFSPRPDSHSSEVYFDSESFDTLESDHANRTVINIEGGAAENDRGSDC